MTKSPPEYFSRIQKEARRRWAQLEADPALAGPWWQLFRQVQSPRHVLSELLQNADDVGANWVRVRLNDDIFEFAHNGEDFNKETFGSLCQFGISNKRHLHTIGFRGVGFKSVFSLGPRVEVFTPTLTFAFHYKRFTEPIWLSDGESPEETVIRVTLDKESKAKILFTEFDRWVNSPLPLLFFQNISRLKIQHQVIHKEVRGPGPVADSEYVWLANSEKHEVLCIRSKPEEFPPEALEEIREERGSPEFDVPPCTVQIVLGATIENRLYTVLPTEIQPKVPFTFNGPFIQDPSRKEIKHPANSSTNTWLLKRIGQLVGEGLEEWLNNTKLDLSERAKAYKLMPEPIEPDGSLEDQSTRIILDEFERIIPQERPILLGHDGSLVPKGSAVSLPSEILDTWEPEQALSIFEPDMKKVLSREIDLDSQKVLKSWCLLEIIEKEEIANRLLYFGDPGPPCPKSLEGLINLWAYLHSLKEDWDFRYKLRQFPIVPVAKRKKLLSADRVLVVGGRESRISKEDWSFLMKRADLVDPSWVGLIGEAFSDAEQQGELEATEKKIILASDLFNSIQLNQKVGLEQIIAAVANKIFQNDDPGEAGIRLAHIAARGAVILSEDFQFLCQDGQWRSVKYELIGEGDADLLYLMPEDWIESNVIASTYKNTLSEKEARIWHDWIHDRPKSKLIQFPIPKYKKFNYWGKSKIEDFCEERGGRAPSSYSLKTPDFGIKDFDWDETLWSHWQEKANEDKSFWTVIISKIFKNWSTLWEDRLNATVKQEGWTRVYSLDHGVLCSAWLHKLRSLPCIPDNFGHPSIPAELCRMTPDTRPLYNIERFVHPDFDKPEYEHILDLLGVRSQAKSTDPLLDRLRALSRAEKPPITHLVDLYRAVDQVLLRMDSEDAEKLKSMFTEEELIYTDDGEWENLKNVFQYNSDAIPGVSVIHAEARNLAMWDRLEVIRRPTLELAIEWLKELPKGELLERSEKNRTVQIMRRAPESVWNECGAWLDTSGRWRENRDFRWAVYEPRVAHDLFDSVKRSTSDFSVLGVSGSEFCDKVGLIPLESALEQRLNDFTPTRTSSKPLWLEALGKALAKLRYPEEDSDLEEMKRKVEEDKLAGAHLSKTDWQTVLHLSIIPYLDGQPVGFERTCKVSWQDGTIFVEGEAPKHHRELVQEISRHFKTPEARRAVSDCIDRDPTWIAAYAKEHLDLEEEGGLPDLFGDENRDSKKLGEEEIGKTPPDDDQLGTESPSDIEDDKDSAEMVRIKKKRQESLKNIFINFMKKQDFAWSDSRSCLVHEDGTVIIKAESPFHWAAYQNGVKKALYWVAKGSIEEGIEIPSDVWGWPVSNESGAYLLMVDKNKIPHIHSLSRLQNKVKAGEVNLFSSKYFVRATGHE